ncbi:MAG: Asp-tRNA(Asn)/Glu-tRNA(Gln) amidotransferase subunit GatC [Clostridium sp.]|nr:Asp-tRNA(Asn)/Glu-tRNA(Gln) amidotransferase subunit GatC [Clostridium sp.]
MAVTRKDVEYIKELARLKMSDEKSQALLEDMNKILGFVDKLAEIDTTGVPITVNPLPLENVYREDQVEESLTPEDFLQNAPERVETYLKVPNVIEREDA